MAYSGDYRREYDDRDSKYEEERYRQSYRREIDPYSDRDQADARAPVYSPPPDKPPIPAGWIPQYHHHYQRWYYYEEASGRSQWEAPGYLPERPLMAGADRAYDAHPGLGAGSYATYEDSDARDHSRGSGMGGALLGAAGGAVAGVVLAEAVHELSRSASDDDSLREAREHYEEALDEARSSDASSSEQEELEEAREEYEEEYADEYYDDD
ncbi:hypothetical protein VTK73DRAFT_536 [Phialemonium thermophilum]|uniref:WW domain-containing protein n=1 Tax=Phialemonium thermophilum TaxID=223376 RepID=A0ABR3XE53_9PEZI